MKCMVCHATFEGGSVCPQCSYDQSRPGANEAQAILQAREQFKDKSTAYAPHSRVSSMDKLRPWLALALGLLLFVFFVRTCATGGRLFW